MPLAKPNVTASLRAAGVTVGLAPERLLFVGQKIGGTATSGALVENILNDKSWQTLFGEDSAISAAIARGRLRNGETQFDAISLEDNVAGVAAAGEILVAGTATETKEITLYIGSEEVNEYKLPITSGDAATDIGDAIDAVIAADSKALVTSLNTAGTVAVTAKNKGTFGNTIGIKFDGEVAGVTFTITAMAAGATDPVLTGVFDVVGNQRYQGIVWQYDQDLDEVTDFLESRFNVDNDILDGVAFAGQTDTFANHLTNLGTLNQRTLCLNVDKVITTDTYQGPNIFEVPVVKCAEFAAVRALRRTDEAILGNLVISRSPLDSFGGPHQNSKPYFNTPFPSLNSPIVGNSFSDVEIEQLKDAGGWVIDTNRPFTAVIAGEVVTTYKTDPAGNPDPTFGFLNYSDTATTCREYIVNNTRARYPQYRATGGALVNGVDSANEASIAAFVVEMFSDLADLALLNSGVGTIGGEQVDYDKLHRENLEVTLDPVTGRFFVSAKLYIIVQLRNITYDFAIAFEV